MSRTQRSGGSYKIPKKESSKSSQNTGGPGISGSADIGNVNGIDISARARFGIDGLIPKQGIDIEQDVTNNTTKIGLGLGSTKGKLGGNIGIKLGHDKDGNIVVKEAEVGINIGGFGGEVSVDDEGNTKTSVSVGGAKLEVGLDDDGDVTISTCYSISGGEICIDFKKPRQPEFNTPTTNLRTNWGKPTLPIGDPNKFCTIVIAIQTRDIGYNASDGTLSFHIEYKNSGSFDATSGSVNAEQNMIANYPSPILQPNPKIYNNSAFIQGAFGYQQFWGIDGNNRIVNTSTNPSDYTYQPANILLRLSGREDKIYNFLNNSGEAYYLDETNNSFFNRTRNKTYKIIYSSCSVPNSDNPPPPPAPPSSSSSPPPPNRPNRIKRMPDCCDKVEEIYKYLGIEKLKKRKFKMAKAFLVPKGTGDETCEDFYEIYENLVRMLANGLIINPIAKPLGSDWQTPNATAWGAQMYAMMAESMSNGDSTQRFEMHAASQLVQMMKVIAELSSKVDFITEVLGITPKPVSSELPVLFTIHENHKGFGKKEPKEIDISKAKTDADVEKVLGKMFQPSRIPYIRYTFDPNHISIAKAISKL